MQSARASRWTARCQNIIVGITFVQLFEDRFFHDRAPAVLSGGRTPPGGCGVRHMRRCYCFGRCATGYQPASSAERALTPSAGSGTR
jgi:hypothetical protein